MQVRHVGWDLIPEGDLVLTHCSAGAAVFVSAVESDEQLRSTAEELAGRGWSRTRTVIDHYIDIDRNGTDKEQQIYRCLESGGQLCDLFVNAHKSVGLTRSITHADFSHYVEHLARAGAACIPARHGPKTFKLEREDIVPLIAWREPAMLAWKRSAARRGVRHMVRADLTQFLWDEIGMKRSLAIDIEPGTWMTWDPGHLLRALSKLQP